MLMLKTQMMKNIIFLLIMALSASVYGQSTDLKIENGTFYSLDGTLFSGTYEQYEGSTKIAQLSVENGMLAGAALYFHTNGQVKEEGEYTNGKRSGNWTQYSELGEIRSIASFKSDTKHGKWMVWDEKGNKRFEMYYADGIKVGTWKMWDEDGNLSTKTFDQ